MTWKERNYSKQEVIKSFIYRVVEKEKEKKT